MALLKSGSTVGGNLIWHQGILPLYPAGDTLYLKNYKIYTENDKPTTEELNVYAKPALDVTRFVCENRNASTLWFLMGRLKQFGQGGETIGFKFYGGSGYNGRTNQMDMTELVIKTGNGDASVGVNKVGRIASKLYRTYGSTSNPAIQNVAIIETSAHNYDVYVNMIGFTNNMICEISTRTIPETAQKFEKVMAQQSVAPVSVMNTENIAMYSTELKPNKSDVGLSNVTNDAQVKKSGDTMTGALYMQRNVSGTAEDVINISGEQHSPIKLFRNANSNLNISFEVEGQKRRYLGIGLNGRLGWGEDPNQGANGLVYTTEFKPSNTDVDAFFQDSATLGSRNLDDVRSPGQYYQVANSEALATRNYPEQKAGSLTVIKNLANSDGYIQEYRVYDSHKIYYRRYRGTWTGWVRIYNEGNKPTLTELDAMQASLTGNWNTTATVPQFVADATNGPGTLNNFGINIPHSSGSFATQITGRNENLWYRSKQEGKFNPWWRIYHEGNKPTPAELGLGNVTNDAQVKKAGDTMTGKLILQGANSSLDVQAASLFRAGLTVNGNLDVPTAKITAANFESTSTAKAQYIHGVKDVRSEGTLTVGGVATFSAEALVASGTITSRAPAAASNAHIWFRNIDGTERGVIWADKDKHMSLRSAGSKTWQFKTDGQMSIPGSFYAQTQASSGGGYSIRLWGTGNNDRTSVWESSFEGSGTWATFVEWSRERGQKFGVNGSIEVAGAANFSGTGMFLDNIKVRNWDSTQISTVQTDGNIHGSVYGGYLTTWVTNQVGGTISDVRLYGRVRIGGWDGDINAPGGAVFVMVGDFGASDGYGAYAWLQIKKTTTDWYTVWHPE